MAVREYHYVMTLQAPAPGGYGPRIETSDGLMDWDTAHPEQEAYWRVFGDTCDYHELPHREARVVFWSFKLNALEP